MSTVTKTGLSVPTAANLTMPTMGGSMVSVPLGELDTLRASAANAMKMAQDFESQQGLIRIEVVERYQDRETTFNAGYGGYDPNRDRHRPVPSWERDDPMVRAMREEQEEQRRRAFEQSAWTERKRVLNISLVNLEEVMEELSKEANFRVEALNQANIKTLEDLLKKAQDKLEKANDSYIKAGVTITETRTKLKEAERISAGFEDTVDILMTKMADYDEMASELKFLKRDYVKTVKEYNEIVVKKSFWAWFIDKLTKL